MFGSLKDKMMAKMASQMKGFIPEPEVIKERFSEILPDVFDAITENLLQTMGIPRDQWDQYMIGFKTHKGKSYLFIFHHDENMIQIQPKGFEELEKLIKSIPDQLIQEKIDQAFDQIDQEKKPQQTPPREFPIPEIKANIQQVEPSLEPGNQDTTEDQTTMISEVSEEVMEQREEESKEQPENNPENDNATLATEERKSESGSTESDSTESDK